MKRLTPFFAVLCMALLAVWGSAVGHPRTVSAYHPSHDDGQNYNHSDNDGCQKDDGDNSGKHDDGSSHDQDGRDGHIGTFLVTITNWESSGSGSGSGGGNMDRSVITLHRDKTMSAIDSNQGNGQFSSQLGSWKHGCGGTMKGRTLEFSFANATINRLDYQFDKQQSKDSISGRIVVTSFSVNADPLGDGGTVIANLEFTGTRVEVPPDKGQ